MIRLQGATTEQSGIKACILSAPCLQQLQQQLPGQAGSSARKPPGKWGMTAEGRATHYPEPRHATDLNDEVCRVCWQGVSIVSVVWEYHDATLYEMQIASAELHLTVR